MLDMQARAARTGDHTDLGSPCYTNGMKTPATSPKTPDLYYERMGSGPDVLLLHGWASSCQMWTALSDALSDRARGWAVDLPGFGHSRLPAHIRPDIDAHMHWVVEFCHQHSIRPLVVIGHSMGGMLALKLAHAHPELVQRLILVCPVVTGRFVLNANEVFASQLWLMISAKTRKFWSLIQSDSLAPVFSAPLYVDRKLHPRYVRDFQRTQWDAAMAALESIAQGTMQPHLALVKQPTLIVVGSRDFTVPPDEGRLAAQTMPHARLVELEGVHHQPLDEAPDRFIPLVRDFVTSA